MKRHAGGSREVLISTKLSQTGGVLVSLRDSGLGIDPEESGGLFEVASAKPTACAAGERDLE
jgi:hypothetical protein